MENTDFIGIPVKNLHDMEDLGIKVMTSTSGESMDLYTGSSIINIIRHLKKIYAELEELNINVEKLVNYHSEENMVVGSMISRIIKNLHEIEAHTNNDIFG